MKRTLPLAMLPLAMLLFVGCPPTPPQQKKVIPASLTVSATKATGGSTEPLLAGGSWSAGDQFAIEVSSEVDAYVYVLQMMAGGRQRVVFPEGEAEQVMVKKGESLRIPPEGWEPVEGDCEGTDYLFVLASQQPLTLADTKLYNAVDRLRRFEVSPEGCGQEPDVAEGVYDKAGPHSGGEGGGGGAGGGAGGGGESAAEPPLPGLEPLPPPPPAPPPRTDPERSLKVDLEVFRKRAVCTGRPACTGARELRSKGKAYVAPFDDEGVVVVELPLEHR